MKKQLFVFLFCISQLLIAQQPGYQSGTATVNLIMPLSIEAGNGDLDFGAIIYTGSPSTEVITPQNGKTFIVKGHIGRNISVVFNDVELTNYQWASNNSSELGTLRFIPEVMVENSSIISSGENLILQPQGLIGELKLNVGGSINLDANQPFGDYKGLFVISVSY